MLKKILIVLMIGCFLLGMATKAEVENVKKETGPASTAIEGGKAFEAGVIDSDVTGEWTQDEIEYFQDKEYVGNEKGYILFSLHYYPLYIKERLLKEDPYNKIAYEKDIITEIAMKQFASLRIENKQLLKRYFILLKSEIYARHGYDFKNLALKRFFEMMPWYSRSSGKIEINDEEKYNIKRIEEREKLLEDINFVNYEYDRKTIVEAKWGKDIGEFGLEPLNESFEWKTYLAVDKEGNVYLADQNNVRINVFSDEGKFVKSVPIPQEFLSDSRGIKCSLVEGIGVDYQGYLYLASSSTSKFLEKAITSEVVIKINGEGKKLDEWLFEGTFVYDPYFYENKQLYLWGFWENPSNSYLRAAIPLETGRKNVFTKGLISRKSLKENKGVMLLEDTRIALSGESPISFNVSDGAKVGYYDGTNFVLQDLHGAIKANIPFTSICDLSTRKFTYKGNTVILYAIPFIDENLNIYYLEGDVTGIKVIRVSFRGDFWE
jgi:hypothetical protein